MSSSLSIPAVVFIVPYRDRENQLSLFRRYMMDVVLADCDYEYQILIVNQADTRSFNRGALKNLGFLWVKSTWPDDYQQITLVFHDVDTMPYRGDMFDYRTVCGVVKHFYGFTFALGGMVSICASDFEKIGGFPNFWAWGFEDNCLNNRVNKDASMTIDRSHFFPIAHPDILHVLDGYEKSVNRKEFDRYASNSKEGWDSIENVTWIWRPDTKNPSWGQLDVSSFFTGSEEDKSKSKLYDVRNGSRPFEITIGRQHVQPRWSMF